jgi:Tfp pilus assembly protein PilF
MKPQRFRIADYRHYTEAIRLDPNYADAYKNHELAYRRVGEHNKANA